MTDMPWRNGTLSRPSARSFASWGVPTTRLSDSKHFCRHCLHALRRALQGEARTRRALETLTERLSASRRPLPRHGLLGFATDLEKRADQIDKELRDLGWLAGNRRSARPRSDPCRVRAPISGTPDSPPRTGEESEGTSRALRTHLRGSCRPTRKSSMEHPN